MVNQPVASPLLLLFALISLISCKRNDISAPDTTYRFSETLKVDGRDRTYTVNLPPNYYASSNFSLVIAMHGGGGDANQFELTSKLTEKANAAQFIVVYPEGVKSTGILGARSWNAGGCCDYARDNKIDDVKFISTLIDKLVATYKINPKKVYATGHSNGGMLAYRLACEIPNKIAAIAPNSCSMAVLQLAPTSAASSPKRANSCSMAVLQPCNPSRPVPVLHMHSVLDTKVPLAGGIGLTGAYYPPIDSVLHVWSLIDMCSTPAQVIVSTGSYTFTKWSNCTNNVTIQYYLTKDGGHGGPGGLPGGGPNSDTPSTAINANNLLWDFFQQYQLP